MIGSAWIVFNPAGSDMGPGSKGWYGEMGSCAPAARARYRLAPNGEPDDDGRVRPLFGPVPAGQEDLPFKVELWDEAKTSVEQVLAITANGSIGYAAYFAATREFPYRYITLRHKNSIISRWNGPGH
jgi:hypothetical protein